MMQAGSLNCSSIFQSYLREVPRYRFISLLVIAALVSGCGPKKLNVQDIAREKKAVESVITTFWKAYESKDLAAMDKFLSTSPEVVFFGTDSAEVVKSPAQWEIQKRDDMQLFEAFKAGELRNLSIQVDSYGELASSVCEIPLDMKIGGQMSHSLARIAMTMKKEKGDWRTIQGMLAFATVGQSSAELVAKMKEAEKR